MADEHDGGRGRSTSRKRGHRETKERRNEPFKTQSRLEKVENRLTPPPGVHLVIVIEYVSAELKAVVATRTIENGVTGPMVPVEPPRPLEPRL